MQFMFQIFITINCLKTINITAVYILIYIYLSDISSRSHTLRMLPSLHRNTICGDLQLGPCVVMAAILRNIAPFYSLVCSPPTFLDQL